MPAPPARTSRLDQQDPPWLRARVVFGLIVLEILHRLVLSLGHDVPPVRNSVIARLDAGHTFDLSPTALAIIRAFINECLTRFPSLHEAGAPAPHPRPEPARHPVSATPPRPVPRPVPRAAPRTVARPAPRALTSRPRPATTFRAHPMPAKIPRPAPPPFCVIFVPVS